MKVLLVNKFHYRKGGSETYYFGLGDLLNTNGYDVLYFSMHDKKNYPCPQEEYFVDNIDYNVPMGLFQTIKASLKLLYSFEAKNKFEKLLIKEKSMIVYLVILFLFLYLILPSRASF